MLYGILIIFLSYFVAILIIDQVLPVRSIHSRLSNGFLKKLFFYHTFLSFVYYLYAVFNPSDSNNYYRKVVEGYRGPEWSDFYGISTTFIEWVGYPFIRYFGFTYEAIMALFALFGFIGFVFFYKTFKDHVFFQNKFFGYDLLTLFFLLPNLHFWSASFGKGSIIFMGIGLTFYGLSNVKKRWLLLFIGALLTYHIRPHVLMVILVSSLVSFTFSTRGLGWGTKFVMIAISIGAFFFIYQDVLSIVGIDQGEEFVQGFDLTHRASELTKATSGIDIRNYSLPLQVFTFLYRPLFFDAPGALGIIVSLENVFLLVVSVYFFYKGGLWYVVRGDFLIKTAFLSFITVSVALAQIAGNLGLAIRQKSQVMLLFLFVILKFLDDQKKDRYRRMKLLQMKKNAQARETEVSEV